MSTFVLKRVDVFPVGTSVSAYPRSAWGGVSTQNPDAAAPSGGAAETQTVQADGSLTFTTLADSTRYYAYALVNGQHQIVSFMPGSSSSSTSKIATFAFAGTLTPGSGQSKLAWPVAVTLVSVRAVVGTAPTGADVIVDVNIDGASAFTNQETRPRIVAGQTVGAVTAPQALSVGPGSVVSIDIDQIGSSVAGSDLTVILEYR
jgi:hypothetical protein